MSDIPRAPDWWLASDGKWYPPTSRPGDAYDTGGSAARAHHAPRAISPALSVWLQVLHWGVAAIGAFLALAAVAARRAFDDSITSASAAALEAWEEASEAAQGLLGFFLLVWLATLILTIVWMNTAHKAELRLEPAGRRWSSGWTVGGWFIPLASLVVPKLVLNEIERIAIAERSSDNQVTTSWRRVPVSLGGNLYWAGFVATSLCIGVAAARWDGVSEASSAIVRNHYALLTAGGAAAVVMGALGATTFRRISQHLHPDAFDPQL